MKSLGLGEKGRGGSGGESEGMEREEVEGVERDRKGGEGNRWLNG